MISNGPFFAGNKISTQTAIGTSIAIAGVAIYSIIKARIEEEKRVCHPFLHMLLMCNDLVSLSSSLNIRLRYDILLLFICMAANESSIRRKEPRTWKEWCRFQYCCSLPETDDKGYLYEFLYF